MLYAPEQQIWASLSPSRRPAEPSVRRLAEEEPVEVRAVNLRMTPSTGALRKCPGCLIMEERGVAMAFQAEHALFPPLQEKLVGRSVRHVTARASLNATGSPAHAMVVAFGFDERTVAAWGARAGRQGQAVQEHLVEQPRDLGQVQADEIRVKRQGGMGWLALAMRVSTRLLAGWRSQRAARHDVDPAADQTGARLCLPSPWGCVLMAWAPLCARCARPFAIRSRQEPTGVPAAPMAQRLHRSGREALRPAACRRCRTPHRG